MRHPTPIEIKAAVLDALHADFLENGYDGPEPFIPARTSRIVTDAIDDACRRLDNHADARAT